MLLWQDLVGKGIHIYPGTYNYYVVGLGVRLTRRLHMHVQGKQGYRAAS